MELLQLNDLRRRVLAGEPVTDEELAQAIVALRNGRNAAVMAASAKKARPSVNAMEELDGLLTGLNL